MPPNPPVRFGSSSASASSASRRSEIFAQVHQEMSDMVGLDTVKSEIDKIVAYASLQQLRRDRNLPTPPINFHMVFRGPPGTGKTEVARKIGRILYGMKFTSKPDIVEVDRSSFTSQYANETPKVVQEKIQAALGGVLFIDEAYTLAGKNGPGSPPDKAGQEAIDTLLKAMEDHRHRLVVICAGYTAEMTAFLAANPGLQSRFGFFIDFPSYAQDELRTIFDRYARSFKYILSADAEAEVDNLLADMLRMAQADRFGNAREVRQRFERIAMAQAERLSLTEDLAALTNEQLATLERADIEAVQ